jgi:hypothetical protein
MVRFRMLAIVMKSVSPVGLTTKLARHALRIMDHPHALRILDHPHLHLADVILQQLLDSSDDSVVVAIVVVVMVVWW